MQVDAWVFAEWVFRSSLPYMQVKMERGSVVVFFVANGRIRSDLTIKWWPYTTGYYYYMHTYFRVR